VFLLIPAQAIDAQHIQSFREFSPRQKPGSFSVDQVMQALKVLQADVAVAKGKQTRLKSELAYDQEQNHANDVLAAQGFA
jgi:hypothetical protein